MLELEAANTGKVLVIGHRGALGHAPENTMASFKRGFELGADLIELDVHMSRDGLLACMHDADVSRTTDGNGRIKDMTRADIGKLDAGVKFDARFRGEPVPFLDEVLAWAGNRVGLVIEIKGDPLPAPGIEDALVQRLRAHGMLDQAMVISFHHPAVRRVKELAPETATGILYACRLADTVGAARAARADSLRPSWAFWTADDVRTVHAAGLAASTWVANDEERFAYLAELGVDSIGTDYPDRLRAWLDRTGRGFK
ncbi:MAG: glycerophosphodiester phosphodiesterase [Kiritimatiellae bacterium]|nr:glycerophosphodiester phosphodiesterase [Kiritimatiellia bacterium]